MDRIHADLLRKEKDLDPSLLKQSEIDSLRLSAFQAGPTRKSKRDREKEAEALKKREAEAEAARAYEEFVQAFEGEGGGAGRGKSGGFVRAGGSGEGGTPSRYNMQMRSAPARSMFADDEELSLRPSTSTPSTASGAKPKGKRAMDSFLEELKRDHAARDERRARGQHDGPPAPSGHLYGARGSKDTGDPTTTNLYVANLPPHITETTLGQFFAKFGPVASVKIMWPRGEGPGETLEERRRPKSVGLSGFVSFMKRRDAEASIKELDGFDWGGSVLKIDWSKAVRIPSRPMFDGPGGSSSSYRGRSRSRSPDARSRHRSRSRDRDRSRDLYRSRDRSPPPRHSSRSPRRRSPSPACPPPALDRETEKAIRLVAERVRDLGERFADEIRARESGNRKFDFLREANTPEHQFYMSLVDPRWRPPPPPFTDEGPDVAPTDDSAEESEHEQVGQKSRGKLGKLGRRRLEAMLRGITPHRRAVARTMVFVLEHSDAVDEVVELIIDSLTLPSTPVPRKLARLHVVSDVLANSAVPIPNAWKYRQAFELALPRVFDHLATVYRAFPSRIQAEAFKERCQTVIDVWGEQFVYPPARLEEFERRLVGKAPEEERGSEEGGREEEERREVQEEQGARPKGFASAFRPAAMTAAPVYVAAADLDGEPVGDADLDGEPVGDADLDGAPLGTGAVEEDLDGQAMDELDGAPM